MTSNRFFFSFSNKRFGNKKKTFTKAKSVFHSKIISCMMLRPQIIYGLWKPTPFMCNISIHHFLVPCLTLFPNTKYQTHEWEPQKRTKNYSLRDKINGKFCFLHCFSFFSALKKMPWISKSLISIIKHVWSHETVITKKAFHYIIHKSFALRTWRNESKQWNSKSLEGFLIIIKQLSLPMIWIEFTISIAFWYRFGCSLNK